jgi:hypothetical protein
MGFSAELWAFMEVRGNFRLLPIPSLAALPDSLAVLSQGSAGAPFIHALP